MEPNVRLQPTALALLGLLADERRLKVVSAVVLGARSEGEVTERTGVGGEEVRQAVQRLVTGGLLALGDEGLTVATDRIAALVRAEAEARRAGAVTPEDLGATPEQVPVLRNFLVDGRLVSIPSAAAKRRVVLEFLSMQFEPGRIYPEKEVNRLLSLFNPDYAALRRYLVDDEFLERRDGFYWRAGGPVELD